MYSTCRGALHFFALSVRADVWAVCGGEFECCVCFWSRTLRALCNSASGVNNIFPILVFAAGPDVRVTEVMCGEVDSPYFETAGVDTKARMPGISCLLKPVLSCRAAAEAVWEGAVAGADLHCAPLSMAAIHALGITPGLATLVRWLVNVTSWTTTPAEVQASFAAASASQ